jgi:hypothetical protein
MVSVDELKDDEEYADLKEDVEEECKRFGAVVAMEIPRPQVCSFVIMPAILCCCLVPKQCMCVGDDAVERRPIWWSGKHLCTLQRQV